MENQQVEQKKKNPKRVEAGKKGAEAKRLKKEAKLQEEVAKSSRRSNSFKKKQKNRLC